jgi:putative tryptophan/tyrosine transport system permease protein
MNLIIGAFTIGLILSLLSLGMLISFRMIRFTDITVDGSLTLGASLTAVLIMAGWSPWLATGVAFLAGCLAGSITGILHTRFKIQEILAGILMMTALYSVNLRVMKRSNIPLLDAPTISDTFEQGITWLNQGADRLSFIGWQVMVSDLAALTSSLIICIMVGGLLAWFLKTHLGTVLRATGNNPQMVRAQGVNNNAMVVFGLAISNGLVALAGALLAQYQGFADVQMGIGMMVWGLASIIIGEALVGRSSLGIIITGAVMGTILFRLLIAIALRWGLNPNDLKLVTAVFVFMALVAPQFIKSFKTKLNRGARHA